MGKPGVLNITPLIDINANLLFFLMINATIQEDRLEAGKDVELPESNSKTADAGDLVSLVISIDHVSVNEILVMDLDKGGELFAKDVDDKKRRVKPLYEDLTTRFQEIVAAGAQPGKKGADELPVVVSMGNVAASEGAYEEARDYYERALAIGEAALN